MGKRTKESSDTNAALSAEERALGMHRAITRRDFLGSAALGSGAALLGAVCPAHSELLAAAPSGESWTGYPGVGDYARSNGNTWEVLTYAHNMRDGLWRQNASGATPTGEMYDLVIAGGG